MTARTGQYRAARIHRSARTGLNWTVDSQNGTGRKILPEQDCRERTARIGLPEKECKNSAVSTGLLG
jgi:hypothetical protein